MGGIDQDREGITAAHPVDPAQDLRWAAWIDLLRRRVASCPAPDRSEARRAVVATVVRSVALAVGSDPEANDLQAGLRPAPTSGRSVAADLPPVPEGLCVADLPGAVHEALLDPSVRRSRGAHYTPAPLASALLEWALDGWEIPRGRPLRVIDLAAGGGAFLLAAARWQRGHGVPVADVVAGLGGVDLDPDSVSVADASLHIWAHAEGWDGAGAGPALVVADGTELADLGPGGPASGQVDLVVGNPPFRSQLSRGTTRDRATASRLRARYGPEVTGYVDDAAVFLRVACEWPRPGGRVVLVQPESTLGSRDAAGVRAAVAERADLVGLWVAGEQAFAAGVDVCAPVLEVRPQPRSTTSRAEEDGDAAICLSVARADGSAVVPTAATRRPRHGSWSALLAEARGVPVVDLDPDHGVLGDWATATAGFRQHFYALAPHLHEVPDDIDPEAGVEGLVPILTTGLVDPVTLHWGRRLARIAGRSWARPAVDLGAVGAERPDVAAWVGERLRPKVLVASQTRVVEAAVDRSGCFVPGVPLVSVEPTSDDDDVCWLIAAVLLAPPVSAWALARTAGTARHRDALRLAARQVLSVPLPPDRATWRRAAHDLRDGRPLVDVGPELSAAYGLDRSHPVTAWWRDRLPGGGGSPRRPA